MELVSLQTAMGRTHGLRHVHQLDLNINNRHS